MFTRVHIARRLQQLARKSGTVALLAASIAVPATSAQAITLTPLIAVLGAVDANCGQEIAQSITMSITMAPAMSGTNATGGPLTKSEAILGGEMSALDRIRQQQAGSLAAPVVQQASVETPAATPVACTTARLAMPRAAIAVEGAAPAARNPQDFLATSRIAIRRTSFNAQWDRVSHASLTASRVRGLVGELAPSDAATLQSINRWVNNSITYREDRSLWSQRDYWATAGETLRRRSGDCEDLAILKYQMLLATGVSAQDMYLTLARDLVRNADHAVLVVRNGDRWYMLDNATDAILPADRSYDYRPTLSFNSESAWLHGATVLASRS